MGLLPQASSNAAEVDWLLGSLLAISDLLTTLWNSSDGSAAVVLPGASPFGRLAFSPDGRLLAQLSPDGILRLWGVP